MNIQYDEMIAVIQAAKEGKPIQRLPRRPFLAERVAWEAHPCDGLFNFADYGYRIKHEPRVVWVNEYSAGGSYKGFAHSSPDRAKEFANSETTRVAVRYREWPEGEE